MILYSHRETGGSKGSGTPTLPRLPPAQQGRPGSPPNTTNQRPRSGIRRVNSRKDPPKQVSCTLNSILSLSPP